jgi:hypothetical protein
MSRNLFAPTRYKVQISGAIGWADLKQRTVSYETVIFATRKDYDVYPIPERTKANP